MQTRLRLETYHWSRMHHARELCCCCCEGRTAKCEMQVGGSSEERRRKFQWTVKEKAGARVGLCARVGPPMEKAAATEVVRAHMLSVQQRKWGGEL